MIKVKLNILIMLLCLTSCTKTYKGDIDININTNTNNQVNRDTIRLSTFWSIQDKCTREPEIILNSDSIVKFNDFNFMTFSPTGKQGQSGIELWYYGKNVERIVDNRNVYVTHTFDIFSLPYNFKFLSISSIQTNKSDGTNGESFIAFPLTHPGFIILDLENKRCFQVATVSNKENDDIYSIIALDEHLIATKQLIFIDDSCKYFQEIKYDESVVKSINDYDCNESLTFSTINISQLYDVFDKLEGMNSQFNMTYPVLINSVPAWQYGGSFKKEQ